MKWKGSQPDRLTRLARAIDALGETDRKLIAESTKVDRLRLRGALDLYRICSGFIEKVNGKLCDAAVLLDPPSFSESDYDDTQLNLFQINLRGRILQLEFGATAELYENDEFRLPYVLRGTVRSFNQDLLERSSVDEHMIFYSVRGDVAAWHFVDSRTYRSGRITENYLISEMERLL